MVRRIYGETHMILDSHFHTISMRKRFSEELPADLIGIDVGTDAGDAGERIALLPQSETIFFSIGSGPWALDNPSYLSPEAEREKLLKDFSLYGADAIGECGFDNHWGYGIRRKQLDLFMMQVELAAELDLPIIIHTRDADDEIEQAFSSEAFQCRGIMHCFSSGTRLLEKALDKGLYISFAGNVTYKSNEKIQEAAKAVPLDRLLYETDSPYLAPIPMRGKACKPEYSEYTLSFLASIRNEDREMIKDTATRNLFDVLQRERTIRKPLLS